MNNIGPQILRMPLFLFCLPMTVSAYAANQVATPAFSPVAGTYTSAQSVTISTTTFGCLNPLYDRQQHAQPHSRHVIQRTGSGEQHKNT
jgi:hypothetical protein